MARSKEDFERDRRLWAGVVDHENAPRHQYRAVVQRWEDVLIILLLVGLMLVTFHIGRAAERGYIRKQLLTHTPGSYLSIKGVGVGIDAFGCVRDERIKKKAVRER